MLFDWNALITSDLLLLFPVCICICLSLSSFLCTTTIPTSFSSFFPLSLYHALTITTIDVLLFGANQCRSSLYSIYTQASGTEELLRTTETGAQLCLKDMKSNHRLEISGLCVNVQDTGVVDVVVTNGGNRNLLTWSCGVLECERNLKGRRGNR
jgi:hypothetical protein